MGRLPRRHPSGAAMKLVGPILIVGTLSSAALIATRDLQASDLAPVDLTQWTPPDIAKTGGDPFGELVRYGYALLTDTATDIGPSVVVPSKCISRNSLT